MTTETVSLTGVASQQVFRHTLNKWYISDKANKTKQGYASRVSAYKNQEP